MLDGKGQQRVQYLNKLSYLSIILDTVGNFMLKIENISAYIAFGLPLKFLKYHNVKKCFYSIFIFLTHLPNKVFRLPEKLFYVKVQAAFHFSQD